VPAKKMAIPEHLLKNSSIVDSSKLNKLVQLEKHKRELEIKQRAQQIDELTLKITALEQELKTNNARNAEILAEIDTHMAKLKELMDLKLS
jgi:TolA-binding protein